jgi:hypothetical protein
VISFGSGSGSLILRGIDETEKARHAEKSMQETETGFRMAE